MNENKINPENYPAGGLHGNGSFAVKKYLKDKILWARALMSVLYLCSTAAVCFDIVHRGVTAMRVIVICIWGLSFLFSNILIAGRVGRIQDKSCEQL